MRPRRQGLGLQCGPTTSPLGNTRCVVVTSSLENLIRDYMNRPLPPSLNPEVLAKTPDDKLESTIFDFALGKIGDDFTNEEEVLNSLALGIKNLYVTTVVDQEVCNGGFNQFYFNSSRKFALLAPAAFEFFQANDLAEIVRAANSTRASEARWIRAITRIRTVESFMASYRHSKLRPVDEQFWRLRDLLGPLRVAKIRANPESFCGS